MSITAVRAYLAQFGLDSKVLEFPVSSATVELAAEAILIVTAGDAKVDNPKFKAAFHTKAKMLTPDEVTEMIGHAIGGVCPFGIKEGVKVYLDESMKRFDSVFPAAGSSNSAIELTCDQLEQVAQNCQGWGDFCKGWA